MLAQSGMASAFNLVEQGALVRLKHSLEGLNADRCINTRAHVRVGVSPRLCFFEAREFCNNNASAKSLIGVSVRVYRAGTCNDKPACIGSGLQSLKVCWARAHAAFGAVFIILTY